MKKILFVVLGFLVILSAVSCSLKLDLHPGEKKASPSAQ